MTHQDMSAPGRHFANASGCGDEVILVADTAMPRSARVQRIIEEVTSLSPAEQAELAEELRLERELEAGPRPLDDILAEIGPIPQDEVDRVRREWPRG